MCRNIKTLFNFDPPATEQEARDAALQYVRKLSGFQKPSKLNRPAFDLAVEAITQASVSLLTDLETKASPKNREVEAEKARKRAQARFGSGVR